MNSTGICLRCEKRSSDDVSNGFDWEDVHQVVKGPCWGCLGILTDECVEDYAQSIVKSIEMKGYDTKNIEIALELPPNMILRDLALWDALKPPLKLAHMRSVKDILRSLLSRRLSHHFVFEHGDCVSTTVRLTHSSAENDFEAVKNSEIMQTNTAEPKRSGNKRPKQFSKSSLSHKLSLYPSETIAASLPLDAIRKIDENAVCSVTTLRSAVYLTGTYCKYSRELSQTPWDLSSNSVQSEITRFLHCFGPSAEFKFSGAGREDQDVRMLGSGRQFVMQVIDPCKIPSVLPEIRSELVKVSDLKVSKDENVMEWIKDGEESKRKRYRAVVWIEKAQSKESFEKIAQNLCLPLKVFQTTPVRVSHRRSLMVRERDVYAIEMRYINGHFGMIDLETQAGTYIKEFVHGDRGRTNPSVASLFGCQADILQLDVLDLVYTDK